jgi:hypothetical protein
MGWQQHWRFGVDKAIYYMAFFFIQPLIVQYHCSVAKDTSWSGWVLENLIITNNESNQAYTPTMTRTQFFGVVTGHSDGLTLWSCALHSACMSSNTRVMGANDKKIQIPNIETRSRIHGVGWISTLGAWPTQIWIGVDQNRRLMNNESLHTSLRYHVHFIPGSFDGPGPRVTTRGTRDRGTSLDRCFCSPS